MKLNSKTASLVRRTARMVPTAAVLMSLVFVAACARTVKKQVRASEQTIQMGAGKMVDATFGRVDFNNPENLKLAAKFEGATLEAESEDKDGKISLNASLKIVMKDLDGKELTAAGLISDKGGDLMLAADAPAKYSISAKCYDARCINVAVQLVENEITVMPAAAPADEAQAATDVAAADTTAAVAPEVAPATTVKAVATMYMWFKSMKEDDAKKPSVIAATEDKAKLFKLNWSSPTIVGGTTGSLKTASEALTGVSESGDAAAEVDPSAPQTEVMDPATPAPALQPLDVRVPTITPAADEEGAEAAAAAATPAPTATPAAAAATATPAPTATPALF